MWRHVSGESHPEWLQPAYVVSSGVSPKDGMKIAAKAASKKLSKIQKGTN